jgi:hypothetical protein
MIPWIFSSTVCFHLCIHSLVFLSFVHLMRNCWEFMELMAPCPPLFLSSGNTDLVLYCSWEFGGLNYTAELFVTILLLVYCKDYSVFIVSSLCSNFLTYSWWWIKADAERREQDLCLCYPDGDMGRVTSESTGTHLGCFLSCTLNIVHFSRNEKQDNDSTNRPRILLHVIWVTGNQRQLTSAA